MSDDADHRFMGRALAAAREGRPRPNPHVGAVIVRDGEVVAVGHHERAGEDHAEVAAIRAAGAGAKGATLYCTLEPCNHFGRTPPCTDAILEAGLARVVVGCSDPAPHVPGATQKLRDAGVEVKVGVREDECRALVADFARHIRTGMPYGVLKAAVTLDGRIAARSGDSRWITGEAARTEAHRLRDRADAVLVGVGTVLADDPALTVRHVEGRDPIRVVLDTHLRTPVGAKLLTQRSDAPTWIVHGPDAPSGRREALEAAGAVLIERPLRGEVVDPLSAFEELGRREVVRLLVEGGARVHGALLRHDLVQAAAVFVAPRLLADGGAQPLADAGALDRIEDGWRLRAPRVRVLGDDVLFEGVLVKGDAA
ncbi:MAG TPA: bifunctional diaminohydroxyphosphoribosylaminopyrimidine deaminase/5-amino-6-(5-phosphoribosylamino)uracil reductase RibD [Sandaracinaceae bacterium LLY-WYZ-13_1]|nr:bifunctional diaminohydroxyphosphoribosylaminopyrimidine deaminase/5-amino-6-(5-phosphoribosylamino)uracil reductase RibD [Sandaracinaceae bacterium LLY-WYZ-13_1]